MKYDYFKVATNTVFVILIIVMIIYIVLLVLHVNAESDHRTMTITISYDKETDETEVVVNGKYLMDKDSGAKLIVNEGTGVQHIVLENKRLTKLHPILDNAATLIFVLSILYLLLLSFDIFLASRRDASKFTSNIK